MVRTDIGVGGSLHAAATRGRGFCIAIDVGYHPVPQGLSTPPGRAPRCWRGEVSGSWMLCSAMSSVDAVPSSPGP